MKKNNILLLVDNYEIVPKLKKISNITFLFPLHDYTVGFPHTFKLEEIPPNSYLFVNRIMDNEAITNFKQILENLPSTITGLVFDDIGVLNILNDLKLNLTTILFLNHLNCNYESINAYLQYVDSVVPSPDITLEELAEILAHAKKPLTPYTFGHINIMYSRRTLLSNYNAHFHENVASLATLEEELTHQKFKIIENPYGTVIYTNKPFNGLTIRTKDNILFNLINSLFLSPEEVLKIVTSSDSLEEIYPYKYLSTKKTIVKIKEEEQ